MSKKDFKKQFRPHFQTGPEVFEKDKQNYGFSYLFFPAFPNSNSPMANHLMLNRWMPT
jgi:hypothetical protein